MVIHRIPAGPIGANCYILKASPQARECVLIDPGGEAEKLRAALGGCRPAAILLTHGHFDHIGAVDALADEDARVYIHAKDLPLLTDPQQNCSWMIGLQLTVAHPALPLAEGGKVEAAGLAFTLWHTPGHTPGGACWRWGEHLFTGDTLFARGYGRTDLPGGDFAALRQSLQRLMPLRETLIIHPGHEA